MSNQSRFERIQRSAAIIVGVLLSLTGVAYPDFVPTGADVDMVRFDAILELKAPQIGTHVMLCARYWVSAKHYSFAVLWAEPYAGSLNFPTHPATLVIHSNEQQFSISNQVRTRNNENFPKPLDLRGVFRHKFNSYPLGDIRFAEQEALASYIYTSDLESRTTGSEDGWKTIDIRNVSSHNGMNREVSMLKLHTTDGRIENLKLVDANDQLIKSIEYEYSVDKDQHLLCRQNIVLPERTLMLGFRGRGATLRIGNEKHTYKEFPGSHHGGGRKCTVEYETVKLDKKVLYLPVQITVRSVVEETILRTARMFNFVRLKQNEAGAEQMAIQFGRFNEQELKVQALFSTYWQKNPEEIEDADAEILRQLRRHFESIRTDGKTVGEKLKRINMLMKLDWIQNNRAELQRHFKEYLAILVSHDLDEVALFGGLHVIDSTVEWAQFPAADQLLQQWIGTIVAHGSPESILTFGQTYMKRRHYWSIAMLLDACSKCSYWEQRRFDAQALKCTSLFTLFEMIQDPSTARTNRAIAQAGWAAWSLGSDNLMRTVDESLTQAKQLFANLDKPTRSQINLKRQLEQIDNKLRQAAN